MKCSTNLLFFAVMWLSASATAAESVDSGRYYPYTGSDLWSLSLWEKCLYLMTPSSRLLISVAFATHRLFMPFIIRGGASHDAQWEVQINLEGESHLNFSSGVSVGYFTSFSRETVLRVWMKAVIAMLLTVTTFRFWVKLGRVL